MKKKVIDISENIEPSIEKLRRLCSLWSKRHLSIIGKITILKAFGLSLFIHLMQSIGISEPKLKEIQSICFRFIWKRDYNEKRAYERVKRNIVCLEKDKGGLNMFNIADIQKSFYLNWALKLWKTDSNWTSLPRLIFRRVGGIVAFNSNVTSENFQGLHIINNSFWEKVFCSWLDMKSEHNQNKLELEPNSPLFNNFLLQYKSRTLFFQQCCNSGFRTIKDMVSDGQIISFELFLARYGSSPDALFVYNAIFNALYKYSDTLSQIDYGNITPEYLTLGNLNTDDISRKHLIQIISCTETPFVESSWKRKYDSFDKKIWSLPFEYTKETKLQIMQWKIIHQIFPSNILLKKMKIKDSENCDFCGEIDTPLHFFFECVSVNNVWTEIERLILNKTCHAVRLTAKSALLGITTKKDINRKNSETINLLILIGKHVISKGKFGKINNFSILLEHELLKRGLN